MPNSYTIGRSQSRNFVFRIRKLFVRARLYIIIYKLISILNIKKLVVYILPCKTTIKYFKNKNAEYYFCYCTLNN